MFISCSYCGDCLIAILVLCCTLYYHLVKNFDFFEKRGIKCFKPLPFFGNTGKLLILKEHLSHIVKRNYDEHKDEKYFGMFHYSTPIIVIKDLNLIKQILVKDFYSFSDHPASVDQSETILYHSLYNMKGDRWREMRTILRPIFANSESDSTFLFIERCAMKFTQNLRRQITGTEVMEMYIKDIMSKFTIDAIASCTFGIDITAVEDPNNEFYTATREVFNVSPLRSVIFDIVSQKPILKKLFSGRLTEKKYEDFYKKIVYKIIKENYKSRTFKKDVINLLISAMSRKFLDEDDRLNDDIGFNDDDDFQFSKKVWTEDEIMAQAVLYLTCGYETTVTVLTFALYALAVNPKVQEKLKCEIDNYIEQHNSMIESSKLNQLKYMDMVINETLRMWSPFGNIDRICTDTYTLPETNHFKDTVTIEKGQVVWVPVHSIHMDEKYYPNPEEFIPERFDDNSNLNPMSFLPFGAGQRACPGNLFVLTQIKMLLFYILAEFKVVKTSKTKYPIKIEAHLCFLNPTEPINLGLQKRTDTPLFTS